MKRTYLFILVALLMASCTNSAPEVEQFIKATEAPAADLKIEDVSNKQKVYSPYQYYDELIDFAKAKCDSVAKNPRKSYKKDMDKIAARMDEFKKAHAANVVARTVKYTVNGATTTQDFYYDAKGEAIAFSEKMVKEKEAALQAAIDSLQSAIANRTK